MNTRKNDENWQEPLEIMRDPELMNPLNPLAIYTLPPGTGLGLAITQGVIQERGGKTKVKSTVGEGTTFTIELPTSV